MKDKYSFEGWAIASREPFNIRLRLLFAEQKILEEGPATVRYKELRGRRYILGVKWALWA